MAFPCLEAYSTPDAPDAPATPAARFQEAPKPIGGFLFLATPQLLQPWLAYQEGGLSALGLRSYLAAHEMRARRCQRDPETSAHYDTAELRGLLGPATVRLAEAEAARREIEAARLLTWAAPALTFTAPPLDAAYAAMRAHLPEHLRRVPMPRRMVRWLAQEGSPGLVATALGAAMRCLRWTRPSGQPYTLCRSGGAISAGWVAACFGISPRSAYRSLAALETLGWLTTVPTPRWHQRRYGPWRVINLAWGPQAADRAPRPPRSRRGPVQLELFPLLFCSREAAAEIARGANLARCTAPANDNMAPAVTPARDNMAPVATPGDDNMAPVATPGDDNMALSTAPIRENMALSMIYSPQPLPEIEHQELSKTGVPPVQGEHRPPLATPAASLPLNITAEVATTGPKQGDIASPLVTRQGSAHTTGGEDEAGEPGVVMGGADRAATAPPVSQQAAPRQPMAILLPAPTLDNILDADFDHLDRLEVLRTQATARGWLSRSAADRLTFVAAAMHARRVAQRPCALLSAMLRAQRWELIAQVDEDAALSFLRAAADAREDEAGEPGWALGGDNLDAAALPAAQEAPAPPTGLLLPAPTLDNILAADLLQLDRLEVLRTQALARGWLSPSAADRHTFVAAAMHACRVAPRPEALFSTMLREQRWALITPCDAEMAVSFLHLSDNTQEPGWAMEGADLDATAPPAAPEVPAPADLSDDARLVAIILQEFRDYSELQILSFIRRQWPEQHWPCERWEHAKAELAQAQAALERAQLLYRQAAARRRAEDWEEEREEA